MAEPTASIDDLLRHEEDTPRSERRAASGIGWWIKAALLALALSAVSILAARVFDLAPSAPLVFGGWAAVLVLRRLVQRVKAAPLARARRSRPDVEASDEQWTGDALHKAVRRWDGRLHWAAHDLHRFVRTGLPAFAELADERLRQRHGITRSSDPEQARVLLGEAAWTLLTAAPRRKPTPQQLAAVVEHLERL